MTTFIVTYRGGSDDRFDREYYVNQHLPLVLKVWAAHGIQSAEAYFPATPTGSFAAIALCVFRNDEGLRSALEDPGSAAVMDDVARFTDIVPVQSRLEPIER